ncbi:MAG: hypothetical protein F6J97_23035 [Leptolyngbya sp. SIO4C1]|nr:hypothetical protein [Leptolyngbya sp. SIO4C1]
MDSTAIAAQGIEAQAWVNAMAIAYFVLLLFALDFNRRLMALIFVPFSLGGEYVFSDVLRLYSYRLGEIPIYVPFGHAILFSMGVLYSELSCVRNYQAQLRPVFSCTYVALLFAAVVFFHDTLSLIFAGAFIWVLQRKGYQTLYFIMGFLVLYVELVGTACGSWVWHPHPFNWPWLEAANPPVAAFACYVLADLGVMKIARHLKAQKSRLLVSVGMNDNMIKRFN